MRMFLIGMTDIFLILYLTSIAGVQATSFLTVEDFYKLQSMHETLQDDKKRVESELQKQLNLAREESVDLTAKLTREQATAEERLARIDQDLQLKSKTLKESEERLTELDRKIRDNEAVWQQKEASYKQELDGQKGELEANRVLAQKFQSEAQKAQQLAEQKQKEASEASKAAEEARAVEKHAVQLKESALKEKGEAERKAHEALEARKKAEAEKEQALRAAEEAKRKREQALEKASQLATAINDIKQDSDAAYRRNVHPHIQQLNVIYEEEVSNTTRVFKRELALLPILINEQAFVLLPSAHIGFSRRYDTAPKKLEITYKDKKITRGFINKREDLIAVALPGYADKTYATYTADAKIDQFMPVLLALRNNGDVNITNLFRGLSVQYFVVNRDNIASAENGDLKHTVKGWRGTGQRAERIIQGDQLVDLNGRFIGMAKDPDHIIRIDSLKGWEEIAF